MPNSKNFPACFDDYKKKLKHSSNKDVVLELNRFSFRYRLAESFEGLIAPDVGRTLLGYDVITKVFLAYTAYEAIVKVARKLKLSSVLAINLNTIYDLNLAKRIRANNRLKTYLLSYPHEQGLSSKIQTFYSGSTHDVVCIAYALRNIFVHGDLTATAIGTETIAKRKLYMDLANRILDYCDSTFTLCVNEV